MLFWRNLKRHVSCYTIIGMGWSLLVFCGILILTNFRFRAASLTHFHHVSQHLKNARHCPLLHWFLTPWPRKPSYCLFQIKVPVSDCVQYQMLAHCSSYQYRGLSSAQLCRKTTLPSINPSYGQIPALCSRGSKDHPANERHLCATGLPPSKKTHLLQLGDMWCPSLML